MAKGSMLRAVITGNKSRMKNNTNLENKDSFNDSF